MTAEKEKVKEYCIKKGYNVDKLDGLREQRLDRYDAVCFRQPTEEFYHGPMDGLMQDLDTIPRVIFEITISTGEIAERPWTKEVMKKGK